MDTLKDLILFNNETLTIRRIKKTDAASMIKYLSKISAESDFLTFGEGELNLSVKDEKKFIQNTKKQQNALSLVAISDGEIIGSLNFTGGPRSRNMHTGEFGVSVLKAHWGKGVATELINCMLKWARESGIVRKINLRVRTDNTRGIALYKRLGFEIEGILTRDFKIGDEFFDSFQMGIKID